MLRFSSFAAIVATILSAEHRCNETHRFKSVLEHPSPLESPDRRLRSADELVGEAGRFLEPIADGAGKDDLLDTHRFPRRGASHPQSAQMATDLGSSVDETLVLETWSSKVEQETGATPGGLEIVDDLGLF